MLEIEFSEAGFLVCIVCTVIMAGLFGRAVAKGNPGLIARDGVITIATLILLAGSMP